MSEDKQKISIEESTENAIKSFYEKTALAIEAIKKNSKQIAAKYALKHISDDNIADKIEAKKWYKRYECFKDILIKLNKETANPSSNEDTSIFSDENYQ